MNAHEIKQAINNGKKVYWSSNAYQVIKDKQRVFYKMQFKQSVHRLNMGK